MKREVFNLAMQLLDKIEGALSDISVECGGPSFQEWKDAGCPLFGVSEHDKDGF